MNVLRTFLLSHYLKKRLSFLAFFYVLLTAACAEKNPELAVLNGKTMGTTYNIKIILEPEQDFDSAAVQSAVEFELARINSVMSTYLDDSELSRFNRTHVGDLFASSPELCRIIQVSDSISEQSGGSFDITVGPLVNLWGFGPNKGILSPSGRDIEEALAKVGYQALDIDCAALELKKSKDIYVDLSAIAKGYATSELGKLLARQGYVDYMVEIGGELSVAGRNQSGTPWRIAIEKPIAGRAAQQILSLTDVSVATSGEYRNFVEVDGRKLSHTIDPKTGRSIFHSLASVTVVSESGELADGWATALNVLGDEKGYALANSLGIAAYFIVRTDDGFEVKYTNQFEPYMVAR